MSKTDRPGAVGAGAPRLPQVNLLPPEVRAARGLTTTKRLLGLALVGVLVVAGLGYAGAKLSSAAASNELADAQDDTVRLKAEETKYAEVPLVVNGLKRAEEARTQGMSTEIQWKGYLDAISAVLPPNVDIATLTVTQGTPSLAPPAPTDVLDAQGVATISFTAHAKTLPDASAWITSLNSIPGFYAATFSTETVGETNGTVAYDVASTVQVAETAYSKRFAATTKGN